MLSFLMQLGFRRIGQPCSWQALSPWEGTIAAHMVQLGLLHPFNVSQVPCSGTNGKAKTCRSAWHICSKDS